MCLDAPESTIHMLDAIGDEVMEQIPVVWTTEAAVIGFVLAAWSCEDKDSINWEHWLASGLEKKFVPTALCCEDWTT